MFEANLIESGSDIDIITPPSTLNSLPFPETVTLQESFPAKPIPQLESKLTLLPTNSQSLPEPTLAIHRESTPTLTTSTVEEDPDTDLEQTHNTTVSSPRSRCKQQ